MMKLLLICIVTLTGLVLAFSENEVLNADYQLVGGIEDMINNTLNGIINNLTDPLRLNDTSLEFKNNSLLSGGLNVTNFRVNGIHDIVASYINVDIFTQMFVMCVDIANLDVTFKYWLDTLIGAVVPLYGTGINSIFFEGIILNISGKVDVLGLKFRNVTANLTIDNAVFNMDGLLDNSEFSALVNMVMNDNFCKFIDDYQEFISRIISAAINAVLGG